jgi:hypothetical protein
VLGGPEALSPKRFNFASSKLTISSDGGTPNDGGSTGEPATAVCGDGI